MVWACFSYYCVGPRFWIKDVMDRHLYVHIMQEVMLSYASEDMTQIWVFQLDNDPKHSSKVAKQWFYVDYINILEWPA